MPDADSHHISRVCTHVPWHATCHTSARPGRGTTLFMSGAMPPISGTGAPLIWYHATPYPVPCHIRRPTHLVPCRTISGTMPHQAPHTPGTMPHHIRYHATSGALAHIWHFSVAVSEAAAGRVQQRQQCGLVGWMMGSPCEPCESVPGESWYHQPLLMNNWYLVYCPPTPPRPCRWVASTCLPPSCTLPTWPPPTCSSSACLPTHRGRGLSTVGATCSGHHSGRAEAGRVCCTGFGGGAYVLACLPCCVRRADPLSTTPHSPAAA